jgi:Fe-S cluster biogenesis protein NfuA
MSETLVRVIETPNPDAYMFRVQETLVPSGTHEFRRVDSTKHSPLATQLFAFDAIELILIAPRFVTVRKSPDHAWSPLASQVSESLLQFLQSGEMAVFEKLEGDGGREYSEIEQQILTLLDEEIRPAVAQDGGDVVFHSFENGIVKLELIGACGTCPSSSYTLQGYIENFLREEIEEIQGVEQI